MGVLEGASTGATTASYAAFDDYSWTAYNVNEELHLRDLRMVCANCKDLLLHVTLTHHHGYRMPIQADRSPLIGGWGQRNNGRPSRTNIAGKCVPNVFDISHIYWLDMNPAPVSRRTFGVQ